VDMTAYQIELRPLIMREIAAMSSEGTVGVSQDCLWQCIASKASKLPSAPKGTNGVYFAKKDFRQLVESRPYSKFVYP